jgi:ATP-dependent DNA helicase RecG
VVEEGADWVKVTLARTAPDRQVLAFIAKASESYPLTQRERIALGLLARDDAMSARELATRLELQDAEALRPWLGRLCEWGLVGQSGRTKATHYFLKPELLRSLAFPAVTTLKRIEDHRLRALVLEDLERYPSSSIGQIHQRIGQEIPRRRLQTLLAQLVASGDVQAKGERRWTRYGVTL